jgi:hypothetical protein
MTGHAHSARQDRAVASPVSTAAAVRQRDLYATRQRIPAQIVYDPDGTPLVQMPVSADYSAVSAPTPLVKRILMRLVHATAIEYPLERRATILMWPDIRLDTTTVRTLHRASIDIAAYGDLIRLPVQGGECPWRWLRLPPEPAQLCKLSQIVTALHVFGVLGNSHGPRHGGMR